MLIKNVNKFMNFTERNKSNSLERPNNILNSPKADTIINKCI